MSMSENELRNRGLNFVRRQVARGKATKKDIERWEDELGPEVRQIVSDAAPEASSKASLPASKPATSKES